MRMCITLTTVCLLLAGPALGASQKDHDDCNSDNTARVIAGCTQVIGDADEKAEVRATAYIRRGLALTELGKLDEAMNDYNTGIDLDPNDALAYNNRAILWREKRDLDRAIADLTKAISIDPSRMRTERVGVADRSTCISTAASCSMRSEITSALSRITIRRSSWIRVIRRPSTGAPASTFSCATSTAPWPT
jgi:tetratricopeptide (TPR) repeat protein